MAPILESHLNMNSSTIQRLAYDTTGAATYVCTVIILYALGAAALTISRLRSKSGRKEVLDRDANFYLRNLDVVDRLARKDEITHVSNALQTQLSHVLSPDYLRHFQGYFPVPNTSEAEAKKSKRKRKGLPSTQEEEVENNSQPVREEELQGTN